MTDPAPDRGIARSEDTSAAGGPPIPLERGLDRQALERVLARAVELQAMGPTLPDVLTEEQIIQIGREVGLSPAIVRQAIAEERTRVAVPEEETWVGRMFGASRAMSTRVLHGQPDLLLARLDTWMQKRECLRVKRRYGERITWERARDMWSGIQRAFSGRDLALTRAYEVAATVTAVDERRSLVRLEADLGPTRRERARASGITAGVGVASGGTVAIVGALLAAPSALAIVAVTAGAAVPVLAGAGIAWGLARQQQQTTHRVQLALEQVLDQLEHG